jgi:NTP pyrophosphatase (non-canonical NTP hydrolase)
MTKYLGGNTASWVELTQSAPVGDGSVVGEILTVQDSSTDYAVTLFVWDGKQWCELPRDPALRSAALQQVMAEENVPVELPLLRGAPLIGAVLAAMQGEVEGFLHAKGWWEEDWTVEQGFAELIALLHSEVSEALEAYRENGLEDSQAVKYYEHLGKNVVKPMGVGAELADVLVRLLHTCARLDVDLAERFRAVMDHNHQRPHRHGDKRL